MNKVREVVEYQRKTDGLYERVELEPSMPRLCESNESKRLCELAAYGNTVRWVKDGKDWAELRLAPTGIYSVGRERMAVSERHAVDI